MSSYSTIKGQLGLEGCRFTYLCDNAWNLQGPLNYCARAHGVTRSQRPADGHCCKTCVLRRICLDGRNRRGLCRWRRRGHRRDRQLWFGVDDHVRRAGMVEEWLVVVVVVVVMVVMAVNVVLLVVVKVFLSLRVSLISLRRVMLLLLLLLLLLLRLCFLYLHLFGHLPFLCAPILKPYFDLKIWKLICLV